MSIIFSFGQLSWPRINTGSDFIRFVCGPISLIITSFDFDYLIGEIAKARKVGG